MFRSTGRKDVNLEKGEGNRRKKSTVTLGHPGAGGLISNGIPFLKALKLK